MRDDGDDTVTSHTSVLGAAAAAHVRAPTVFPHKAFVQPKTLHDKQQQQQTAMSCGFYEYGVDLSTCGLLSSLVSCFRKLNLSADEQEADGERKSFRDKVKGNPSAQALLH